MRTIVWLGANGGCTESQHHCFSSTGRNAGFQSGQLTANELARGKLIVINTAAAKHAVFM